MEGTLKRLVLVSVLLLVVQGIGTAIAVTENLPAKHIVFLGGEPSGMDVTTDFLTASGTALSAPFMALLLQAVFTGLVFPGWRIRIVGMVGLTIMGALYIFGFLGEPIVYRAFNPVTFNPGIAALLAATFVLVVLLLVFGVVALTKRKRLSR